MALSDFDIDDFLKRSTTSGVGAPPVQSATAPGTRFYERPIQIPQGVKSVAKKGLGFLGRVSGPLAVASAVPPLASLLKSISEAAANAYVGGPSVKATTPSPLEKPLVPQAGAAEQSRGATQLPGDTLVGAGGGTLERVFDVPALSQETTLAALPPSGTGLVRNNTTGTGTGIDARGTTAYGAPSTGSQFGPLPEATTYRLRDGVRGIGGISGVGNTEVVGAPQNINNVGNIAGNFVDGLLGMKQIVGDNTRRAAVRKQIQDALLKLPAAQKAQAETTNLQERQRLAQEAKARGASASEQAAILSGRSTGGQYTFFPGLTPDAPAIVGNRATGAVESVRPKTRITESDIQATMRANKMTRAQVIERLKAEGQM